MKTGRDVWKDWPQLTVPPAQLRPRDRVRIPGTQRIEMVRTVGQPRKSESWGGALVIDVATTSGRPGARGIDVVMFRPDETLKVWRRPR